MSRLRERYRVDLPALQCVCEINYVRLLQLLPEMRLGNGCRLNLSRGERSIGALVLQVLEVSPFTTSLMLRQEQGLHWLPMAQLEVRVYHDVRMAEVVAAGYLRHISGRYAYPNEAMLQPDEKAQLNVFLGEWLSHCLLCGHELQPMG
jgi:uncharacterized protein YqiB (DUF1249 family)